MNLDNEFDELARRKLQEQAFPFEEAHWSEMQKTLNGGHKGRTRGVWLLGAATVLLVGISAWWLLQDTSSTGQVAKTHVGHSNIAPEHAKSKAPAHPVTVGTGTVPSAEKVGTTGTATEATDADQPHNATTIRANSNTNTGSENRITSSNPSSGTPGNSVTAATAANPSTGSIAGAMDGPSAEQPEVRTPKASPGTNDAMVSGNEMTKGEDHTNGGQRMIASTAVPTGVTLGTIADGSAAMSMGTAPEVGAQQTNEVGNENTVVNAEDRATHVNPADSLAAEPTMASVTSNTPADSASTTPIPSSIPPLVPERAPWEIGVLGGIFSSSSTFTGGSSAEWGQDVTRETTTGFGAEMMHMGRNIGVGMGVHYSTYAERITFGELSSTVTEIDNFWFLTPVDTTILFVSDTINAGTDSSYYVGQSIPATINVLAQGADTTTTTTVSRQARELVNRTSYLEVPLLIDVHVVQGRWSLGLRGGPTVGFLTGRTGALPNATDDGYTEFSDQAFREVMVGYTARAYIRYRWNAAWSIGLEPAIRGQLMNSLGEGPIDRRSSAFGGMISLSYRLR